MEQVEVLDVKKAEKPKKNWFKELLPYIIIIIVVVLIRTFLVTPVQVDGSSMYPTLQDKQLLLLKKYDHTYKRFDVVVFHHRNARLIKRIIGLPGETVEYLNDTLYINGKKVEENFAKNSETLDFKLEDIDYKVIPKDKYFVMGDNRNNSTDSRIIGLIDKKMIQGSTNLSIFPLDKLGFINK